MNNITLQNLNRIIRTTGHLQFLMIIFCWITDINQRNCSSYQIMVQWQKLKVAYTALPRVTPPHATNCLLERIGGTSLATPGTKRAADGMAGFPESSETTSPLRVTSYWGPDGSTKMVRRLEYNKDRKHTVSPDYEVACFGYRSTYIDDNTGWVSSWIRVLLWVVSFLGPYRWTSAMWGTQCRRIYTGATSCRCNQSLRLANRINSNHSLG